MKKTFDINRFWQVLKWTVLTEKKSIFTAVLAFLAAFLAIQLFSCFTIFDLGRGLGPAATYAGMVVCGVLLSIMTCYYACGILGNAKTTQQRCTALMLPASNMEKFIARVLYCCILMPVLLYVACYAATGLRMLLEWVAGHDFIVSGLSFMNGDFVDNGPDMSTFFNIAMTCWNISLFALGGVFFHQRPFVWTTVTIVAVTIVLGTLFFYLGVMIGEDNLRNFFKNFKGMTFETFDLILSIVLTVFTVLNIWLSYRLFKGLQVVQHKWFNV